MRRWYISHMILAKIRRHRNVVGVLLTACWAWMPFGVQLGKACTAAQPTTRIAAASGHKDVRVPRYQAIAEENRLTCRGNASEDCHSGGATIDIGDARHDLLVHALALPESSLLPALASRSMSLPQIQSVRLLV
jgi:hypothetical protein